MSIISSGWNLDIVEIEYPKENDISITYKWINVFGTDYLSWEKYGGNNPHNPPYYQRNGSQIKTQYVQALFPVNEQPQLYCIINDSSGSITDICILEQQKDLLSQMINSEMYGMCLDGTEYSQRQILAIIDRALVRLNKLGSFL